MRIPVALTLFIIFHGVSAQKEASVWYFGQNGAGMDFKCDPPIAVRSGMYWAIEGCSSISDEDGNLLFYTNGDSVYDRNHEMMVNGYDIGNHPGCWGSSTQGALIVSVPDDPDLFYIFTVECAEMLNPIKGFRYSIVDLSLNGGLGEVILKAQLLHSPITEKLAAVKHGNGVDIWIVVHEHDSNAFLAYLLTSEGIVLEPIISYAGQVHSMPTDSYSMARGYMKFSPNGQKLLVTSVSDHHMYTIWPELFDFDDVTGSIALKYTILDTDSIYYYGASFSPDNRVLYLSGGWHGQRIHQFDSNTLSSQDFLASKYVVADSANIGTPGALQLGPDGRLYVATNEPYLNRIPFPNTLGAGCGYEEALITLSHCPAFSTSRYGLPNFPEDYFRSVVFGTACSDTLIADFVHGEACFGEETQFGDASFIFPDSIQHWSWNFGDPASGAANYSNEPDPQHLFSEPGSYEVQLVVQTDMSPICKIDSITYTVVVQSCTPTDVGDFDLSSSFNVFPNPSDDEFNVSISTTGPLRLQLYDTSGKIIWEYAGPNKTIDFGQELAAGLYILRIEVDEPSKYVKVVKR